MKHVLGACALAVGLAAALGQARPRHDVDPVSAAVQDIVAAHGLEGATLAVWQRGEPVHVHHVGLNGPDTRLPIASASKWLSALVLARLVERGEMHWDDPVGAYLADAPLATRGIRLRQLFSHTSGIASAEHACLSQALSSLDACARQILAQPLAWAPGTTFAYGGNSMQVAGRMAEVATGRSWDQLVIDELAGPLGLSATDYAAGSSRAGYVRVPNPRVGGGARSSADDLGRVIAMVLAGGMHRGQRYLRRDTLDYMALDHAAGMAIGYTPFPESQGYGIGQWREAVDAQGVAFRLSSPGAFGTTPWVDRRAGLAGVFFVRGQWSQLREDVFDLQALCAAVFGPRRRSEPIVPGPAGNTASSSR